MSIADKLNSIISTKENLRQKLNSYGLNISESVPFAQYPTYLNNLPVPQDSIDSIIDGTIRSIIIPNGVDYLGEKIFSGCFELYDVSIPEGVTFIGSEAFAQCSNLTSIIIPATVTSITSNTFYGCYRLTEIINLSPYVTIDGDFDVHTSTDYTSRLTNNNGFILLDGNCLLAYHPNNNQPITSIMVPSNVTTLHDYAFCNYYDLTTVVLNENITNIPGNVFYCDDNIAELKHLANLTDLTLPASTVCTITNGISSSLFGRYQNSVKLKVHVPSNLIDSYKSANLWSSYLNSNKIEFVAIGE